MKNKLIKILKDGFAALAAVIIIILVFAICIQIDLFIFSTKAEIALSKFYKKTNKIKVITAAQTEAADTCHK